MEATQINRLASLLFPIVLANISAQNNRNYSVKAKHSGDLNENLCLKCNAGTLEILSKLFLRNFIPVELSPAPGTLRDLHQILLPKRVRELSS